MGDEIPSPEEQLSLALQGIDQILGDLRLQHTRSEKSHDMPANDDVQVDQTALRDLHSALSVAHEDPQDDGNLKTTTEGQVGEGDAPREAPSSQPAQNPVRVGHGLFHTQGDAMANIAQQQELPRGGTHGVYASGPERPTLPSEEGVNIGETEVPSFGKKDPPWHSDPPPVRLRHTVKDDLEGCSMQIISTVAKGSETQTPTAKAHSRSEYFPHSEWDEEVGGFVPTDPLPHPMILGKITVLIESMIAWKINHGEPPGGALFSRWRGLLLAGSLAQNRSEGPSVEAYLGYQASLADSGAQISSISPDVCEKLGIEPEDYLPTEMEITGASKNPLAIQGVILARVQVGRLTTYQMMYVIDNHVGPILSRKALTDLAILPKDFPCQRQVPRLRRPFLDFTGEAVAGKVIRQGDGSEAKVLQAGVQPASCFDTRHQEDLIDGCMGNSASTKDGGGA